MQESEDRAAEAEVLVNYALLMECVQQFEWSLKTLAIHRDESMESRLRRGMEASARHDAKADRPAGGTRSKRPRQ